MNQIIKEKLIKERNDLALKIYKLNKYIDNVRIYGGDSSLKYFNYCIYQYNLMNQYLKVLDERIKLIERMK